MDGLRVRTAELERQLGEHEAQRDDAVKERDRLRLVEVELNEAVKKLKTETSALKVAHLKELEALTQPRQEMEEELQRKHEAAVGELKTAKEEHDRQLRVAEKNTEAALSEMR